MSLPRRNEIAQERTPFGEAHAQVTAGFGVSLFKVPTGRKWRADRVGYYNPTGLAAHADNWYVGTLRALRPLVVADDTFVGEADDNLCTAVAHGLQTGDGPIRVANSGGALPTGLAAATDYYVIRADADTFSLATTRANALAGTAIDITGDGSGTQTLSDTADTKRLETVATIFDTDTTGAALAAATWTDGVVDAAEATLAAGEELWFVVLEGGTATLPAGRFYGEGRYVS